jgi:hypothetical protein
VTILGDDVAALAHEGAGDLGSTDVNSNGMHECRV